VKTNVLRLLVVPLILAACGCARVLPDLNKMQTNMDYMVHYMGMMVNGTQRMANAAERMERKSDGLMADLGKKGGEMERAVQNYTQAFIDNDRAMIKSLQGIKMELGELKQNLRQPATAAEPQEQARNIAAVQTRLNTLENQLKAMAAKIEKMNGGAVSKQ